MQGKNGFILGAGTQKYARKRIQHAFVDMLDNSVPKLMIDSYNLRLKIKTCLALATDSHVLLTPKIFWPVLECFFFFYLVCLVFRLITVSNILVHSTTMRIYASIRNRLDAYKQSVQDFSQVNTSFLLLTEDESCP